MNSLKLILLSLLTAFAMSTTFCQTAPMFGKDIVLSDIPAEDMTNVAICSDSNGLMFAAYYYLQSYYWYFVIMKSEDHGLNWDEFFSVDGLPGPVSIRDVNLVLNGTIPSNMKLFAGFVSGDPTITTGHGIVFIINVNTASLGSSIDLGGGISDLALASDYLFPPSSTSSYSIGFIYSKWSPGNDSIFFYSTQNGQLNLENKRLVAVTPGSFRKVGLAYGYSPLLNTGRYFATWERQESVSDTLGNIYTAHSEPNFDSPFTTPVCLDCDEPSITGKVRNPSVAVQCGNSESDSSDLTQVVVFEKYNQSAGKFDIMGAYNLQSTSSSHFQLTTINGSVNGRVSPDVVYNNYISSFDLTCQDQTTGKLPYLTNSVNLNTPAYWNIITSGYNDSVVGDYANPVVAIDHSQHTGMNVWLGKDENQNPIALFDSPASTYTWNPHVNTCSPEQVLIVFPNPCSEDFSIEFKIERSQQVKVDLITAEGTFLCSLYHGFMNAGLNRLNHTLPSLVTGMYFISLQTEDYSTVKKIIHITD